MNETTCAVLASFGRSVAFHPVAGKPRTFRLMIVSDNGTAMTVLSEASAAPLGATISRAAPPANLLTLATE
jgi:hypothetical protein